VALACADTTVRPHSHPDIEIKSGKLTGSYRKGDYVHHPQHGVGIVKSISERSFYGAAPARYAQLYFEEDELTLTVLENDLSNVIRCLLTPEQSLDLLEKIKNWDGQAKKQWKAREDAHKVAFDAGDPFEYAKVLKGLVRLEKVGDLRPTDRRHLNRALDLLAEELGQTLKKTTGQVRNLIDEAARA
jgi:RNA polymerase-interacting CarD/CdnL/TRCF family regulator